MATTRRPASESALRLWKPRRSSTLYEREEERQQTLFVGRKPEIALLQHAMRGHGASVFYLYGPGGIGKTSLLQAFAAEARLRSVTTTRIDARDLEPKLPAVLAALDGAALSAAEDEPGAVRRMVQLDTYEHLRLIEPLVRREVLRRVRGGTILVIAGRLPPSAEWRSLSLWGSAILPIALRNLNHAETTEYLGRRGIRDHALATMLAFSHGHPLALALIADAWRHKPDMPFSPTSATDTISALYEYFVRGVSEPERRAALEVAAVLHTTSEAMLGTMLECDPSNLFIWLRELNFMEIGSRGVFPHDLAREVILADLRWRNPERLAGLALRAQRHYVSLMSTRTDTDPAQAFADFSFVVGHNPRLRMMMSHPDDNLMPDDLRDGDESTLCAAVLRHEGATSLRCLQHWLEYQPSAFKVVRSEAGSAVAFAANIRLDLTTAQQRSCDPVVLAAWDYGIRLLGGPPRGPLSYGRFVMACDTYQDLSPALAICWQFGAVQFFLPGFTLSFARLRDAQKWEQLVTFSGAHFVPELRHIVDGRAYEVTLQDQRGLSPTDWLKSMNERTAMGDWRQQTPVRPDQPSLSALSREDFVLRVRDALRMLHDPIALAENPLIHSHAVRARVTHGATSRERASALRLLLLEKIEALRGTRRGDAWYRVLHAAYLQPVGKHESAADELGMSYSTFRRRLDEASRHLVSVLWERELS
ncbi:AAA family ATPase [Sorangium sp. So ce119]|uniref:AAA family ATPase n=1 Tax=Sorangium sp. So ce119 TaxID=3133279 RepID=UPI003F604DFC